MTHQGESDRQADSLQFWELVVSRAINIEDPGSDTPPGGQWRLWWASFVLVQVEQPHAMAAREAASRV